MRSPKEILRDHKITVKDTLTDEGMEKIERFGQACMIEVVNRLMLSGKIRKALLEIIL